MSKVLLGIIFSLVFFSVSIAQKGKEPVVIPELPVDSVTRLYSYSRVVEIPGVSKEELYNKAFAWANGFYKNPGDVIREKNPEEGRILIKARFRISNEPDKKGVVTQAGDVMYSLTLYFKEGKYKYEITRINWQQTSYFPAERWKDTSSSSFIPSFAYYLKQTDVALKAVEADLVKKMSEGPKSKPGDW